MKKNYIFYNDLLKLKIIIQINFRWEIVVVFKKVLAT